MNRSATTDSGNSLDGQLVSAHDPIMDTTADIMLLYRIDPSRNMARFYRLAIQPTLLGGSSLVRNWGQIGTEGRPMVELYDTPEAADTAFERVLGRKLRRGYRYDGATCFAQENLHRERREDCFSRFRRAGDAGGMEPRPDDIRPVGPGIS
ncbi:hypothetical protein BS629_12865 [Rhizobium leguminosarum bv. viciae USDA 2370]|jgi:predicted DNA-binding WGR domain protein|nr:WGR domain-containing protein [Rhizobium leguminosarum bv. viciae]OOO50118.1 hypothetical protein BS629_12865 [Rhizobium leguminosarum bv. viciae USDA 2370]